MNQLEKTLSTLTAAWMTLGALSFAQGPDAAASTPPPRVPRPAQVMSSDPRAAEPAPAVPSSRTRPVDAGPQLERPAREPVVVSIVASDERYSHTYWDTDEHGTIWVRARLYKASFGADGATYYPLFGSKQPRHYPLQLSLASATSNGQPVVLEPITGAVRDGDNVVIHRGIVDEVYEVGVESLEQTFVVRERPQGDLQLFVSLQSEMVRSENEAGFEFSNDMGAVHYGRAFARESNGTRRALTTQAVDTGVRIDVDAQYMATRPFPLVIDPMVSTFAVDTVSFDNFDSDVAYDATTDRYLFVYEEAATSSDHDIFSQLRTATGAAITGTYVDATTTQDWLSASVANLNAVDQFLVVASVLEPGSITVRGRLTSASTLSYGAVIPIATSTEGFRREVSVGGDPYGSGPAFYCVAYVRNDRVLCVRLVTSTGTLQGAGPLIVELMPSLAPAVSKGNGGTRWNIAWNTLPSEVHCAQVEWDGSAITTPSFAVPFGGGAGEPSVSSPRSNGDYLVAWEYSLVTDYDIRGALISGGNVSTPVFLTGLEESGSTLFDDQGSPHVDCDGDKFVMAYTEQPGSGSPSVYLATYYVLGGQVGISEGHVAVATTAAHERCDSLVSTHSTGGAAHRFAVSWSQSTALGAQRDIRGGLYDSPVGGPLAAYCFGDGSGVACPCGNNGTTGHGCASSVNAGGALLASAGNASISGDTVVLTASGLPATASCLFFQGTTATAATFGDGLRCAGGSVIRLAPKTASGGTASFPTAGNPHVSVKGAVPAAGGMRFYQCWYRNSGAFCSAATYNLTNGMRIVWLP